MFTCTYITPIHVVDGIDIQYTERLCPANDALVMWFCSPHCRFSTVRERVLAVVHHTGVVVRQFCVYDVVPCQFSEIVNGHVGVDVVFNDGNVVVPVWPVVFVKQANGVSQLV